MNEELTGIVQRMIDAGEPEENIALVIKNYGSEVKKKDSSGQDSKTLGTPSSSSGETANVNDGSSLIKAIEDGEKAEKERLSKEAEAKKESEEYDSVKAKAIGTMKNLYKKIEETSGPIEDSDSQLPNIMEDGINVMPSDNTFQELNNPEFKQLHEDGAATLENARKAFKVNFFEENPDLVKEINSGDEEKVAEVNQKLIDAWVKEPAILSGSEANLNDMSNLEKTYHYFKEGMDERDFNLRMASELSNASDEEAKKILELEYDRSVNEGADINLNEPELTSLGGISKMAGTQAEPIVTASVIGVIPGLQPLSIAYSSADAAATSYGAAFRSAYVQARSQGMDQEKAYKIAKSQSKVEGVTGGIEGALGAFTGGAATKAGGKLAEKFGSKALRPLISKAAEGTTDMGLDASAAMIGQVVNNWTSRSKGLDVGLFDGVADEMLGEVIFSAGMKVPGTVQNVAQYKKYLNSLPPVEQQKVFDQVIDSKDKIDQKVLKEKIVGYLDVKSKEAEAENNEELSKQIKEDPATYLGNEKKRLETISNSLKNEAAKSEVNDNVKAIDMMINNLPQYTVKSGDGESALTRDQMMEKINDPAFVESVAQGETDLDIVNDNELAQSLQEKVDNLTVEEEFIKADDTERAVDSGLEVKEKKNAEDLIVKSHKEGGGSSISQDGDNLYGKTGFAVSAFPERTKIVKGKEITTDQVNEFKEKNKDLLEDKDNFIGTWYDKDSDQTYIDVSNRQETLDKATEIAKKYNQKAIFDLKSGEEVDTGGTGTAQDETSVKKQTVSKVDDLIERAKTDEQKKALGTIKNVVTALSGIDKDAEVVVHEDVNTYNKAIEEAGGDADDVSSGFFDANGKIHINAAEVQSTTAFHEGGHKVITAYIKRSPEALTKFEGELRSKLPKEVVSELDTFTSEYAKDEQSEEFVTEALARIADGQVELDKSALEKIKQWLRDVAKSVGLNPDSINLDGKENVQDFARKISEAFNEGKAISIENAKAIDDAGLKGMSTEPVEVKPKLQKKSKAKKGDNLVKDFGKISKFDMGKHMTEDGEGNYLFFHYSGSDFKGKKIDPKYFGKNPITSDKRMHGVSFYYTKPGDREGMVGEQNVDVKVVKIPVDKVYPLQSDPLDFYDQAEKEFREDFDSEYLAFAPHWQASYIGKVARDNGFELLVSVWDGLGKKSLRGESQIAQPFTKGMPKLQKKSKVQKDIDKETGVTKPTTWIKMTEKSALKEKIKNLARGYREGTKTAKDSMKEVQTELLNYVDEAFKGLEVSKATERQVRYMVRNVNTKNIETLIDRVDAKVEKAMIVEKKQTLKDIVKIVSDKKSILKKRGSKWVGKVSVEAQDYIKNFSLESLNGMSNKELNDVKTALDGILKEGVKEVKALERAKHAQKRINKAESFEAFYEGETLVMDTNPKELTELLTDPNKIALVGNQLVESKTALDEYLKDNPEASLEGVKVFDRKSKQIAKFNEDRKSKSILSSIVRFFDPTRRKANLRNHLSHFAKAGKKGRLLADKIYQAVVDADNNRNEGIRDKKKAYVDAVSKIFGKKTNPYRRLSQNAKVQPHGEMAAQPSNGQVVHWYNMYQTKDGREKIDGDSKFDIDVINAYMNDPANADLKAYADYLLNDFYVGLKSEYEPTYTHITGTKFPEGAYYPLFSTSLDGDVHDVASIMDDNGNVNYKTAVSGNLIQRVKHNNPLDYTRDAHEVALNYISTMERAKHFVPVGELVNSTFNKSSTPEIINLIGSGDMVDLTDHLTASISGESPRKQKVRDSKFVNTIQGVRVFGALAFKMGSVPKQLTSAGRFTSASDITIKDWIKGFAPVNKQELDVMAKIASSPYVKERFKGESIDIEANRLLNPRRGAKAAGFLSKATRAGMVTTSIGDIGGVLSGGSPYALAIYRKGIKDGLTPDQAYEKAYKRFVEVSEETQQSTAIHETSHMQRDNIGRLFSSFTTSQTQGANKLVYSTRMLMSKSELTAEEKKHHAYNIVYYSGENMFFSIVASGFLKEMLTADWSDEDDIENLKKGTYDTVMDNISSILSGLDYWGYLANYSINHSRGDDWKNELPVIQEMQRLAYGTSSLGVYLSSGGDWDSLTNAEKKDVEKMFPVDAIIKQFDDWKKYREGDKGFIDALMGYKTAEEKKKYKKVDKIYEGIFGEPYKKSGDSRRSSRSSDRKSERTSR